MSTPESFALLNLYFIIENVTTSCDKEFPLILVNTFGKNRQQVPLTLMNQWPFNHIKHIKREMKILHANENGRVQKNEWKTEKIPVGHSSALKQRARNFFSKKNQKLETEKFYIIILLLNGCAVELWAFNNCTTIRQNMLSLLLELYIWGIL